MKFARYDSYKDSELEWIENIPSEWAIDRVKNIATVRGRVGWKALKASEYVDKSEYIFLATPNIKYEEIDFENVNYLTKERYDESPEIMLRVGDVLLTKDGSTLGTVNVVKYLPTKTTVNSSIAVIRFKQDNSRFIMYQIKSDYIQNIIKIKKDGAGVPHLFQKDINDFRFLLPDIQIQNQIANYLDMKTSKIDKEISILEQKTEKYKELKQTLIAETVLRGLNKNVALKDSKTEWIGHIPEHWEIKRIDNAFQERSVKVSDADYPALSVTKNGVVPQLDNVAKTMHNDNRKLVKSGDYVINSRSDRRGSSGLALQDGSVSVINIVLQPKKDFFGKYLHHLFRSYYFIEEFYRNGKGIVDDLMSTKYSLMRTIDFPIPPYKEQIEIASYLDEKTLKIDSIVKAISKKIEMLKEFRKTLINDVVTGKVKVA